MNKIIPRFIVLLLIVIGCTYVSLPPTSSFTLFGKTITFERKNLDFTIANVHLQKEFDLALGLDLAGGSHLVFDADTTNLDTAKKQIALDGLKDVIERRVNLFGVSEPNVQIATFEGRDRIIVELPGINDTKEAVDLIGSTAQLTFAEIGTEENPGIIPTNLSGADLMSADVTYDQTTGKPVVSISFTPEGSQKFADITARNVGNIVPILIDGVPISTPVVQEAITGGSAVISGDFTLTDAKYLSIQLNAGALPIPVSLVEQRVVGASLGSESIQKSVVAGLIGLSIVVIFMLVLYGPLGLVAVFALYSFAVLTLTLYKVIPVVITLPGIAGFLLSVGMAVDSNILIFERFKEEKRKRNIADALEVSFGKAWDSIRDANIATLATAFILANPFDFSFLHTSGPVRGFALTLALGIFVSLFTGLVVSRTVLRIFVRERKK
jgi:preprotein translocase subunit SecD